MTMRVLLVEDEALIRFVLVDEIEAMGWTVTEVSTPDEAIVLVSQGARFDVVVTDVNMPGTADGFDLAKQVRKHNPSAKIMIMSSKVMGGPGLGTIYDKFVAKPFIDIERHLKALIAA